jgi:hypothetical protein
MKHSVLAHVSLLAVFAAAGCASTKMTAATAPTADRYAKPERVFVYDFAATPDDIAADAALGVTDTGATPDLTPEQVATARKLGALVAEKLVEEIRGMGLNAVNGAFGTPEPGDLVLKGYFQSMDKGSAIKRVGLGFGAGAAELQTVVKGYEMTTQGLVERGSAEFDSGGGKSPGLIVPIAVVVATANPVGLVVGAAVKGTKELTGSDELEGAAKRTAKAIGEELHVRFERQGWI